MWLLYQFVFWVLTGTAFYFSVWLGLCFLLGYSLHLYLKYVQSKKVKVMPQTESAFLSLARQFSSNPNEDSLAEIEFYVLRNAHIFSLITIDAALDSARFVGSSENIDTIESRHSVAISRLKECLQSQSVRSNAEFEWACRLIGYGITSFANMRVCMLAFDKCLLIAGKIVEATTDKERLRHEKALEKYISKRLDWPWLLTDAVSALNELRKLPELLRTSETTLSANIKIDTDEMQNLHGF